MKWRSVEKALICMQPAAAMLCVCSSLPAGYSHDRTSCAPPRLGRKSSLTATVVRAWE